MTRIIQTDGLKQGDRIFIVSEDQVAGPFLIERTKWLKRPRYRRPGEDQTQDLRIAQLRGDSVFLDWGSACRYLYSEHLERAEEQHRIAREWLAKAGEDSK